MRGVRVLTGGTTRTVVLVGRWALKIPGAWYHHPRYWWKQLLLGLLANMQEVAFSRLGWEELCPVVGSLPGGLLVVMARAEPLSDDVFLTLDLESLVNDRSRPLPVEPKRDSFGTLDGRLVAVDYGSCY